jgi:hypothetical protein
MGVRIRTVKADKYGDRFDARIEHPDGRDVSTVLVAGGWAAAWDGSRTSTRPALAARSRGGAMTAPNVASEKVRSIVPEVRSGALFRCDAGCDHGYVYMPRRKCERCEGTGWLTAVAIDGTVVWLLEMGLYDEKGVVGIYSTAEQAMEGVKGTWQQDADGDWSNDLDWDDAARVTAYRVGQHGSVAAAASRHEGTTP